MAHRMTVPPRREGLQDEYQEAAQLAREALADFQDFDKRGDSARARHDFRGATQYWQEAEHALTDSLRQRKHELRVRQDEFEMYKHLDDEYTVRDNQNAIGYCERRIKKLRFSSESVHIKTCLAHLEDKNAQMKFAIKETEAIIINDDLRSKAKGFKHHNHNSFGNGWQQQDSALSNTRPPHVGGDGQFNARRLQFLERRITSLNGKLSTLEIESRRWERDWQQLTEEVRDFNKECARLDDAARRHHERKPPVDYEAEDREAARKMQELAARRRQLLLEEQERKQAAEQARIKEQEEVRQQAADAENDWEEEYGAALEEDPDFISGGVGLQPISQPRQGETQEDTLMEDDGEVDAEGDEEEVLAWREAADEQQPVRPSGGSGWNAEETTMQSKEGWGAAFAAEVSKEDHVGSTADGWNHSEPEKQEEVSSWELDYQAANGRHPTVDEIDDLH